MRELACVPGGCGVGVGCTEEWRQRVGGCCRWWRKQWQRRCASTRACCNTDGRRGAAANLWAAHESRTWLAHLHGAVRVAGCRAHDAAVLRRAAAACCHAGGAGTCIPTTACQRCRRRHEAATTGGRHRHGGHARGTRGEGLPAVDGRHGVHHGVGRRWWRHAGGVAHLHRHHPERPRLCFYCTLAHGARLVGGTPERRDWRGAAAAYRGSG